MQTLTIGIAGGSGSGKTTAVDRLIVELGIENASLLEQDAYYQDPRCLSFAKRSTRNYDHPDAIDAALLALHIRELQRGRTIHRPCYDFAQHRRATVTRPVEPRKWIIVEGILVLAIPDIRETLDLMIYVDTDADVRLARRIRRDMAERGRSLESILEQWEASVRPMHQAFVEPSRRYAHLILPETGVDGPVLPLLIDHLRARSEP